MIIALTLAVSPLVGVALRDATAARPNTLWVWSHLPPQTLMSMAGTHQVGRLLVWVAPGFSEDPGTIPWLHDLQKAASRNHVSLDALGGDPSWAQEPATAGRWSAEATASGLFERLHLDIEPHALSDWSTSSAKLMDGTIEALRLVARTGVPVDADVPYWFGTFHTSDGRDGLTAVSETVASITVMAYQDQVAAIERVAQPAVAAGARAGIPVWVGVNLREPVGDAPSSSLWGADGPAIIRTLKAVSHMRGIAGIALHDADAVAALDSGPQ